ncbi:hypothetical protein GGI02_004549, partial [Coemansia sp. RSA 2322]
DLQIRRMLAAAEAMEKLLPPAGQASQVSGRLVSQFEEPLSLSSLEWYTARTFTVCDVYRQALAMREEHVGIISKTIDSFAGLADAPAGALDSDTQLVHLATWLHSPGLQNAKIMDHSANSTLMLSDYGDMLRIELGIEQL